MPVQCAIKVTKTNLTAIVSEAGRSYTKEEVHQWFAAHGEGYFVRDESGRGRDDCKFYSQVAFDVHYMFENGNEAALFRNIQRRLR